MYATHIYLDFISMSLLLDPNLLESSHFEDSTKEFLHVSCLLYDWKSSYICFSPLLCPLQLHHSYPAITHWEIQFWGYCHHKSASCIWLMFYQSPLRIFYQELSWFSYPCFLAGITISCWVPLLSHLWPWEALMTGCSEAKWTTSLPLCSSHVLPRWF